MNRDRLAAMANQIARNLATMPPDAAAAAMADHLVTFWAPSMIDALPVDDPALWRRCRSGIASGGIDTIWSDWLIAALNGVQPRKTTVRLPFRNTRSAR